ncbi:hypothetical protein [Oceanobacillus sp. CAU 1775]
MKKTSKDDTSINQAEKQVNNPREGVQLELVNVGESSQSIFEEYFHHIEEAHENMIYHKTEKNRRYFLKFILNLQLPNLHMMLILIIFTIPSITSPDASDLLVSIDSPMMLIGLGSYLNIQNMIRDYILTVK